MCIKKKPWMHDKDVQQKEYWAYYGLLTQGCALALPKSWVHSSCFAELQLVTGGAAGLPGGVKQHAWQLQRQLLQVLTQG